jgi:hypothetical protein
MGPSIPRQEICLSPTGRSGAAPVPYPKHGTLATVKPPVGDYQPANTSDEERWISSKWQVSGKPDIPAAATLSRRYLDKCEVGKNLAHKVGEAHHFP